MVDNITMEKCWEDDFFFEVSFTCKNPYIEATTNIYLDNIYIDQLCEKIDEFTMLVCDNVTWASGSRGIESTPCVELNFFMLDKLGHVCIEVFMELNDHSQKATHNCCFYINTELGALERFGKKIKCIGDNAIGTRICLNDEMI